MKGWGYWINFYDCWELFWPRDVTVHQIVRSANAAAFGGASGKEQ